MIRMPEKLTRKELPSFSGLHGVFRGINNSDRLKIRRICHPQQNRRPKLGVGLHTGIPFGFLRGGHLGRNVLPFQSGVKQEGGRL